jgi:hypothetical protein
MFSCGPSSARGAWVPPLRLTGPATRGQYEWRKKSTGRTACLVEMFSSFAPQTPWANTNETKFMPSLLSSGPAAPTTRENDNLEHLNTSVLSNSTSSVNQSVGLNRSTARQPIDGDAPPFASLYDVGGSPDRVIRSSRGRSIVTPETLQAPRLYPPIQEKYDSQSLDSSFLAGATTICVFGFPTSFSAAILSHFRDHGDILHHEVATDGNWMYITYTSRFGAQKALNQNGRIVYGVGWQGSSGMRCMVGVRAATEQEHSDVISKLKASQPAQLDSPVGTHAPGGWTDEAVGPKPLDGLQPVGQRLTPGNASTQKVFPPPPSVTLLQPPSVGKAADWLFGWM